MNRDQLVGHKFPVLDQGWVQLEAVMGTDQTVVDRARGTTGGSAARRVSSDRDLIRLMMRKHHGSSFEFPEIDIQFCTPFLVWRQVIRHRAGNIYDDMTCWDEPSVNELSGRYSVLPEIIQAAPPGDWREQSKTNRQGSGGRFPAEVGVAFTEHERHATAAAVAAYDSLIKGNVAREQARKVWPIGGYTVGFVKMDLRNWLHWLALRLAPDAQEETRAYANVVGDEIIKPLFPVTYEAFEDYVLNAVTLSRLDIEAIATAVGVDHFDEAAFARVFTNSRERDECRDKLCRIGITP